MGKLSRGGELAFYTLKALSNGYDYYRRYLDDIYLHGLSEAKAILNALGDGCETSLDVLCALERR